MDSLWVFSSLYPSRSAPLHGLFVRELTRHLAPMIGQVRVIAPVNGWRRFPGCLKAGSRREILDGIRVAHPPFWTVPKVMKRWDGRLLAFWTGRSAGALAREEGRPDLIHAHYAYPEAFAAGVIAERMGVPLVVTVHGSDINVLARDPQRAPLIIRSLRRADAVVAVSRDLKEKVRRLTGRRNGIFHIPNGMDGERFRPGKRTAAKHRLGLSKWRQIVMFAGRLDPVKGLDRLIRAVSALDPGVGLVIAGEGALAPSLKGLAGDLGIADRVVFPGGVPHERLAHYFQAADLLVLASRSEGWPTVILEAMACGIPVVAPKVGGIPEIIVDGTLGILTEDNRPESLKAAMEQGLARRWDETAIRGHAGQFAWSRLAREYLDLYRKVLDRRME